MGRVSGAWSSRTAERYVTEFKQVVEPLAGSEWAHILFLEDWLLGAPEIEQIIGELVAWCYGIGIQCTALVYSSNQLKDYQIDRIIKHRQGHFERQTFNEADSAFAWLADKGFDVAQPERLLA